MEERKPQSHGFSMNFFLSNWFPYVNSVFLLVLIQQTFVGSHVKSPNNKSLPINLVWSYFASFLLCLALLVFILCYLSAYYKSSLISYRFLEVSWVWHHSQAYHLIQNDFNKSLPYGWIRRETETKRNSSFKVTS